VVDFQAIDLLKADITIDKPRLHRGSAPGTWQDRQVLGRRIVLALRADPTFSI
jgi:hypothetical protein